MLWLDVVGFSKSMLLRTEKLNQIKYFTTTPTVKMGGVDKIQRHKRWLQLLNNLTRPIIVYEGRFKLNTIKCKARCKKEFKQHVEKRTDINIAVQIIGDAVNDYYDVAYIVSGDTDFAPAIEFIKNQFPEKEIKVLCPPKRKSKILRDLAHFTKYLSVSDLIPYVLPDKIIRPGKTPLTKPASWINLNNPPASKT